VGYASPNGDEPDFVFTVLSLLSFCFSPLILARLEDIMAATLGFLFYFI
jgi:hypothetical protein